MAAERRGALGAVVRERVCARARRDAPRRPALAALGLAAICLSLAMLAPAPAAAVDVEVEVEGLRGPVRDNVLALLSIAQERDPSPERVRQLHNQAEGDIQRALQPFGYYKPTVDGSLTEEGDRFVARYGVDPGPLLRLAGVDVQLSGGGAGDKGFRRIVQRFPLRSGSPLLHASYEEGKQSLVDYAAAHGYLDADFDTARDPRRPRRLHRARAARLLHRAAVLLRRGHLRRGDARPRPALRLRALRGRRAVRPEQAAAAAGRARPPPPTSAASRCCPRRTRRRPPGADPRRAWCRRGAQRWSFGLGYGTDTGVRGTARLRRAAGQPPRPPRRGATSTVSQDRAAASSSTYLVPKRRTRAPTSPPYSLGYDDIDSDTETHRPRHRLGRRSTARAASWREHFDLAYRRRGLHRRPRHRRHAKLLMPEASCRWCRPTTCSTRCTAARCDLQLRGASESALSTATFVQGDRRGEVRAAALRTGARPGRACGSAAPRRRTSASCPPRCASSPAATRACAATATRS